jgi:uncharacterized lipoprotein YmbA
MPIRPAALALAVLSLAACGEPPQRFAVPDLASGERVRIAVSTVEVRDVSLPTYARSEEIWRETAEGALVSDPSVLWADEPTRGVTQELVRNLSALTGARVASEPWPFDEPAQARLEVRVEEMIAGADGRFRLKGQYFTASRSGGRDRAGSFDLWAPLEGEGGASQIAAARAAAVKELARQIAANGL